MKVQYLFDSEGRWIAFRQGKHLFAPMGDWLGWFPWGDDDAVDPGGEYLGTVYLDERLYRFSNHETRVYSGHPDDPGYGGYPGSPGRIESGFLPAFAKDVQRTQLVK